MIVTIKIEDETDILDFNYAIGHDNYHTLGELICELRNKKCVKTKEEQEALE